jgi:hypothetical protein
MRRPSAATGIPLAVTTAFLLLLGALPARGAGDDPVRSVRVINFPAVHRVTGSVSIEGTIPHAILTTFKDLSVPPVEPTETGRLIDGGILQADGFTGLVLSLSAKAGGRALRSGSIGVRLVPDDDAITKAFEEDGQVLFPIELGAPLTQGAYRMTATAQERFTLGFPRYRVRLYNTTDKTVSVNLYAYLTH